MKVQCSNCRQILQISDELLGQQVRCPECEYIVQVEFDGLGENGDKTQGKSDNLSVPQGGKGATIGHQIESLEQSAEQNEANESPAAKEWFLRIPEGHEFGPISLTEMDKWVEEGRVATDCRIRNDQCEWQDATEFYPEILGSGGADKKQPLRRLVESQGVPRVLEPHRGSFILALAFAGCVIPFLSIWPAVIGTRDLQRMSVGKMDLSGEAMTRSGQAIAMVASMIWFGAFAIALLAALISAMNAGFA